MNKKTILIKNYLLSTDVLYLDYTKKEEDFYHRLNIKQAIIIDPENIIIENNEPDGKCIYKRRLCEL